MLKSILKLNGAQQLSKKEQKQVNGGNGKGRCAQPAFGGNCPNGTCQIEFNGCCLPYSMTYCI